LEPLAVGWWANNRKGINGNKICQAPPEEPKPTGADTSNLPEKEPILPASEREQTLNRMGKEAECAEEEDKTSVIQEPVIEVNIRRSQRLLMQDH
jgi:hypothetical protein